MPITRLLVLACICLSVITSMAALAAPSADSARETILQIVNLNGDCRPDTIYGRMNSRFQFVPTKIAWGGIDSLHMPPCPGSPPPFYPRRRTTTIEFPPYTTLSASISFDRVNLSNTSRDIVIHYFWKLGDSATGKDSARAVVIFSQRGLDSVATINMATAATIGGFQMIPFFAMELRPGLELAQPAVRDVTGRVSYILLPVVVPIPGSSPKTELADVNTSGQVRISPNPAHTSTEMTGRLIPPGDYSVEVISVNGSLERRADVSVEATGDLFKVIDLHDLASGYYVVVLHTRTGDKPFGTYPIIITR